MRTLLYFLKSAAIGRMILITMTLSLLQSCKQDENKPEVVEEPDPETVLEIKTEAMELQMADTIPSGWYTWRYENNSNQTHFILIDDYPDGKTMDTIRERILPIFGDWVLLMEEGKTEEAFDQFARMPEWFGETKWPGGVGFTSPGQTTETTIKLEPGNYFAECYVRMETGMWHTNMGMIEEFTVTEEDSGMEEPTADIALEISSQDGIVGDTPTHPGTYTISVEFLDQIAHENFMGHDVNLVRLDEGADPVTVETWFDWRSIDGLREPAPKGFTFLGGVNDMPAGNKGYFKVDLEPGKYALISEVPNATEKGMLRVFSVENE